MAILKLLLASLLALALGSSATHSSPCVIRYSGSEGLANYMGSHLTAMTLALFLKCDVALPPGMMRPEYAEKTVWYLFPGNWVFDISSIQQAFAKEGLTVHATNWSDVRYYGAFPFPAPRYPVAHQPWAPYPYNNEAGGSVSTNSTNDKLVEVFLQRDHNRLMEDVVYELMRTFNVTKLAGLRTALHGHVVDLGFTLLLGAATPPFRDHFNKVFENLKFTPFVETLANHIVNSVRNESIMWHGLHLRIEADYVRSEQQSAVLTEYVAMMKDCGFNTGTVVYVAGAISRPDLARLQTFFNTQGVADRLVSKLDYLDDSMLQMLPSEVTAAVDFLVLCKSFRFLGYGQSSFSYFVSQFRKLQPDWSVNREHKVLKTRVYEVLHDHYRYEGPNIGRRASYNWRRS